MFSTRVVEASDIPVVVAGCIVRSMTEGIARRGEASLVLAGGTTFKGVYMELARDEHRGAVDWTKVRVYFGDERCVSPESELSNYKMAHDAWLYTWKSGPGPVVFRIKGELAPEEACGDYVEILNRREDAVFDIVLLGMGSDGHTASLFDISRSEWEGSHFPMAITQAGLEPFVPRITMTPLMLNQSRATYIVVTGSGKREAVANVLADTEGKYPVSHMNAAHGDTVMVMSAESAP
jgi:6-phosphogluconolactonase